MIKRKKAGVKSTHKFSQYFSVSTLSLNTTDKRHSKRSKKKKKVLIENKKTS